MNTHECIACGVRSWDDGIGEWWPVREDDEDEYEALCDRCARQFVRCDCCGDAHHENDMSIRTDRWSNKEWWTCLDCNVCSNRCSIREERSWRADKLVEERIKKQFALDLEATQAANKAAEERALMSEVRESLQVTLDRQAQRNRTTV